MYEILDVQNTWDVADAFDNALPHHLDPWLDEEESELRSELHKFWLLDRIKVLTIAIMKRWKSFMPPLDSDDGGGTRSNNKWLTLRFTQKTDARSVKSKSLLNQKGLKYIELDMIFG